MYLNFVMRGKFFFPDILVFFFYMASDNLFWYKQPRKTPSVESVDSSGEEE